MGGIVGEENDMMVSCFMHYQNELLCVRGRPRSSGIVSFRPSLVSGNETVYNSVFLDGVVSSTALTIIGLMQSLDIITNFIVAFKWQG